MRVEQLYPIPATEFTAIAQRYPAATEIVWVQEEPENMGARLFAMPLLHGLARPGVEVSWVARRASASPATGSSKVHDVEQQQLLDAAFGPLPEPATIG